MIKLLFDAGHYAGYNSAPLFPKYKEGDKMFTLVCFIKKYIEENYEGVQIGLTRTNNSKDVDVYTRGKMAKGYNAFYSFHSNYVNDVNVERVVIYKALGSTKYNTYAKELGDVIKKCMEIYQNTQVTERAYNGTEYYGVLRGAKDVGVNERYIIEHSFHSSKRIAQWLYDDNNLKKLAIVEGDKIASHHGLKKKSNLIKVIADVNYRSKPIFNDDKYIVGKAKKGDVFTVVDKVKSDTKTMMYKLKSGNYITTSSKYVTEYKKD